MNEDVMPKDTMTLERYREYMIRDLLFIEGVAAGINSRSLMARVNGMRQNLAKLIKVFRDERDSLQY